MKVGWVGLGKLGLPCALTLAQYHDVRGYDVSGKPWDIIGGREEPMREEGIASLLASDAPGRMLRAGSVADVVKWSDIVFVAVQTPHAPEYGGEQPMPDRPRDFEYAYLVQACREACTAARQQMRHITLVVVSTVLPGTTSRLIRPLLNAYVQLVYSPQFIAMGTTIRDFTHPEFVICGTDHGNGNAKTRVRDVFLPVHDRDRLFFCDIETAEAVKVFYNTFISMKIVWANHVMELCEQLGADCDRVVDALELATDRVISPKYMRGGMGDGGSCHPRDLIALFWLEQRLGTSYRLFGELAWARERQTGWLAALVRSYAESTGLRVAVLGESYKPGSDLTAGSPARLLGHYLGQHAQYIQYDPYVKSIWKRPQGRMLYVIATRHEEFREWDFAPGSVVIDPFGYIPDRPGVVVVRVGRK